MNLHIKCKSWHLDVSLHRRMPVLGVNSKLAEQGHVLLWDFDGVPLQTVKRELRRCLSEWDLSDIQIMQSSIPGNFHAYCFTRVSWGVMLHILASTRHLDQQFFKLGVMRGYMTLRFSDKPPTKIVPIATIKGQTEADVDASELTNFERYWTKVRHHGV